MLPPMIWIDDKQVRREVFSGLMGLLGRGRRLDTQMGG